MPGIWARGWARFSASRFPSNRAIVDIDWAASRSRRLWKQLGTRCFQVIQPQQSGESGHRFGYHRGRDRQEANLPNNNRPRLPGRATRRPDLRRPAERSLRPLQKGRSRCAVVWRSVRSCWPDMPSIRASDRRGVRTQASRRGSRRPTRADQSARHRQGGQSSRSFG